MIPEKEEIMNQALFTSSRDDWATPPELFTELDQEFHFTLDACASVENTKCARFYTEQENGLTMDWQGETVFCNPPYSRAGGQDAWVQKCFQEGQKPGTTVVALLPARTDTKRFHTYIYHKAEIRFLPGRVKFVGAEHGAPFPSMIVIWRG